MKCIWTTADHLPENVSCPIVAVKIFICNRFSSNIQIVEHSLTGMPFKNMSLPRSLSSFLKRSVFCILKVSFYCQTPGSFFSPHSPSNAPPASALFNTCQKQVHWLQILLTSSHDEIQPFPKTRQNTHDWRHFRSRTTKFTNLFTKCCFLIFYTLYCHPLKTGDPNMFYLDLFQVTDYPAGGKVKPLTQKVKKLWMTEA